VDDGAASGSTLSDWPLACNPECKTNRVTSNYTSDCHLLFIIPHITTLNNSKNKTEAAKEQTKHFAAIYIMYNSSGYLCQHVLYGTLRMLQTSFILHSHTWFDKHFHIFVSLTWRGATGVFKILSWSLVTETCQQHSVVWAVCMVSAETVLQHFTGLRHCFPGSEHNLIYILCSLTLSQLTPVYPSSSAMLKMPDVSHLRYMQLSFKLWSPVLHIKNLIPVPKHWSLPIHWATTIGHSCQLHKTTMLCYSNTHHTPANNEPGSTYEGWLISKVSNCIK